MAAAPSLARPDLIVRRVTLALLALMAAESFVFGLDLAFPPNLRRAHSASPVVLDRNGAWLRALPVESGRWRLPSVRRSRTQSGYGSYRGPRCRSDARPESVAGRLQPSPPARPLPRPR